MASDACRVMLAKKWDESIDPTGWWMSEKLDGVRAYWTGSGFYSRNGNKFIAPKFFYKDLPKEPLDGELWCGRGLFSKTMSIIKKKTPNAAEQKEWEYVTYLVFDAPTNKGGYEKRVKWIQDNIDETKKTTFAAPVGVQKCKGVAHLKKNLKAVLVKAGEGIMLRQAGSMYEHKRSGTLLKCKYFHDEEAKVTGSEKGTGRCATMMGKVHCVLPNGTTFKVGSGFTDVQRRAPPVKGDIITFKYQELSNHGNPRFPVFVRARPDLEWSDVLKNVKTKQPFSQMKRAPPILKKQHSILFSTVPSRTPKGDKVITTDDEDDDGDDDDDEDDSDGDDVKQICKFGAMCFRTNRDHLKKFLHPKKAKTKAKSKGKDEESGEEGNDDTEGGEEDDAADDDDEGKHSDAGDDGGDKPMCRFGSKCYRTSVLHLKAYSHARSDKGNESDGDKPESEDDDEEKGKSASDWRLGTGSKTKKKGKGKDGDDGKDKGKDDDDDEDGETVTISKKEWDILQSTMKKLDKMKDLVEKAKSAKRSKGKSDGDDNDNAPPAKKPKIRILKASDFATTDGTA